MTPTDCECNYVDIGVGEQREPNINCPVHGEIDAEQLDDYEIDEAFRRRAAERIEEDGQ